MNYWLRTSICFLILLFGHSQVGLAVEELSQPIRMAVGPVNPDEPGLPSCGADGVCRINECQATPDPDCPSDVPDNPTQSWNKYPSRPSDIKDCTSQETTEIAAAIDWGQNTGKNIKLFSKTSGIGLSQ